ncbi:hypothetical protein B0A55_08294 [Friedmanniomyces simplex]|uniref:AB hydrolase-1 domain-containing protein n=1 Tax=Friedmanniomyces simplex TaxID=329884 RepID=A0A4U0WZN8_9PEZI|nr:hypothetical protein B0A55_08294 [Friedmanniomyces simplex]
MRTAPTATKGNSRSTAGTRTLHFVPPNLTAFEPLKPLFPSADVHTLLWIGGLFDTLLSVAYPLEIAQALPATWSLATASLGSAGKSWGVGSIAQDAEDIAKIVAYFRTLRPGGKIVLMGHSTGCQDSMEHLVGPPSPHRPPVDGMILQAPVSDREAMASHLPEALLHEANQLALKMCREGHEKDALPYRLTKSLFGRVAVTARRWVDLATPGGADDYFSSDLSEERLQNTFGRLPARTPVLVLYSGSEENVPSTVDKDALVRRWIGVIEAGGGKVDGYHGSIVPEATHNLNGCPESIVRDLVQRVVGFVGRLDNGDFHTESKM